MSGIAGLPPDGLAVLIDPDRSDPGRAAALLNVARDAGAASVWVGGSFLHTGDARKVLEGLLLADSTGATSFPIWSILGVSSPDGLIVKGVAGVFLPLIGTLASAGDLFMNAYRATPVLSAAAVPVVPVAYLLVDGGRITSAAHALQGLGIPRDKPEVAVTLCRCAAYIGARMVFLDAGSGATDPVPLEMLARCCAESDVPVAVGGGIRTADQVMAACRVGARIVVVGTATESPDFADTIRTLAASADRRSR